MDHSSSLHDFPQDITFYIGPIGTPNGKTAYEIAVKLNDQGERDTLVEYLEHVNEALRKLSGCSPNENSMLKGLLTTILDRKLGPVYTFVGTGFLDGIWTPTLTIHLDRSEAADGTSLGHLLHESQGQSIAAMLGITFKADWISTVWHYPAKPLAFSRFMT